MTSSEKDQSLSFFSFYVRPELCLWPSSFLFQQIVTHLQIDFCIHVRFAFIFYLFFVAFLFSSHFKIIPEHALLVLVLHLFVSNLSFLIHDRRFSFASSFFSSSPFRPDPGLYFLKHTLSGPPPFSLICLIIHLPTSLAIFFSSQLFDIFYSPFMFLSFSLFFSFDYRLRLLRLSPFSLVFHISAIDFLILLFRAARPTFLFFFIHFFCDHSLFIGCPTPTFSPSSVHLLGSSCRAITPVRRVPTWTTQTLPGALDLV